MDIEPGISPDYLPMDPKRLLERFHTALNTRDITNLVQLLQVDYEFFDPAHPERNTMGLEAARTAWNGIFTRYPGFRADLLRQAIEGNTIWSEWRWAGGPQGNENGFQQVGVIIFGVEQGLLAWARTYMLDSV